MTNALAAYEDQAKSSLLGKQRRSGRYNTTDIAQNPPEIRWPNEGYHSTVGKKGVPYDELSMAQWVTGQLNNVHNMKDPLTARHALLQVILDIKDATSLPRGQLEVCGPPPCMTWRRVTFIGMMPLNGPSTASAPHRCPWPTLKLLNNITLRKFVNFTMKELVHTITIMGPTGISAVTVRGQEDHFSIQSQV